MFDNPYARAGVLILALAIATYSWLANFMDLPTTNDPVIGIILGSSILLLVMFGVFVNQEKKIAQLSSEKGLVDKELEIEIKRDDWFDINSDVKAVRFRLINKEDAAIFNCVAHIAQFDQISGTPQFVTTPIPLHFDGQQSPDGIKVQKDGDAILNLAKSRKNEIGFEIMKYPDAIKRPISQNLVVINIFGQVNGLDRKPKRFGGKLGIEPRELIEFQ
jgi:hypothetical protein